MSAPEPVVVYMTTGGTFRKHAHGAKVWTEGRWLPARAYAALLARLNEAEARANTATVAADLMRARAEKAERERDEAVGMLKEARGALEFYATGRRNAFRCASESIDLTKGTGPCCERVIDAGGIAQDALSRIDALTKARG